MTSDRIIGNVLAGVLIAVMNITVAISVAALMFAGLPASYLAPGIVVLLIGTIIVGVGGTLFSDFSGVVCAPRSGLAPVFAAIVTGIYLAMQELEQESVMPTILVAIMLTSCVTGLFLLLLGRLKLGNLVRYIPYPVMGGFFAGIGYIFIRGGLAVAMGAQIDFSNSHLVMLGVPALVFAIALYVGLMKFDHWSSFPVILISALVAFYCAALLVFDRSVADLMTQGWLPEIDSTEGSVVPVIRPGELALVDWVVIFQQSGGILVVALLSAIVLLLDISGIEIITKRDLDPDRELQVMGVTNIASGVLGGYPGVHVASDTAFTYKLGGDSRLMGIVYAGVVLATLVVGSEFIGLVPTFILGGLLVYVGLDFMVDWVWKTRKDMPAADYAIILAILAVIAVVDILEGVAFGCAVAIVLFVVNYSRLSVIRSEATGSEHASNVDRDLQTRQILNEEGDRVLILALQGFIFFGTSDKLLTQVREKVAHPERRDLQYLVLDFHHVSQLDTSAIKAFAKLEQLSERFGFHIVITGADQNSLQRLDQIDFLREIRSNDWQHLKFETLDDGVAWCEDMILDQLELAAAKNERTLQDLLELICDSQQLVDELASSFVREERQTGEFLFHQGDPGRSMYLVGKGLVAIVLETGGRTRVVRHYAAGAVLGEMALYTGASRSASVMVEEDAVLYRLDDDAMTRLQEEHPPAAAQVNRYIVQLLAERLGRANRELSRYH